MHTHLYSLAVAICRRNAVDRCQALQWAQDALTNAWQDVDDRLRTGHQWEGEPRFVGLVKTRVIFHALRRREAGATWNQRVRDLPATERGEDPLDAIRSVPPNQGEGALAIATTRAGVAHVIGRVRRLKGIVWNRPKLAEVLDASLAYLRACCERAAPDAQGRGLPLGEVIPYIDRDAFEATETELNRFIMARLGISRNVLDQRRRQIRMLGGG